MYTQPFSIKGLDWHTHAIFTRPAFLSYNADSV